MFKEITLDYLFIFPMEIHVEILKTTCSTLKISPLEQYTATYSFYFLTNATKYYKTTNLKLIISDQFHLLSYS